MEVESLRLQSKYFPRLFTGRSVMDGMVAPDREKRNLSTISPLLTTSEFDFTGLKLIFAQVMSFSRPWRIHPLPGTDVVVTVRSSLKALIGGSCIPVFIKGRLHSTSADLTIIFMARAKKMTELVQPVIMPFSSLCQSDVPDPAVILRLNSL